MKILDLAYQAHQSNFFWKLWHWPTAFGLWIFPSYISEDGRKGVKFCGQNWWIFQRHSFVKFLSFASFFQSYFHFRCNIECGWRDEESGCQSSVWEKCFKSAWIYFWNIFEVKWKSIQGNYKRIWRELEIYLKGTRNISEWNLNYIFWNPLSK